MLSERSRVNCFTPENRSLTRHGLLRKRPPSILRRKVETRLSKFHSFFLKSESQLSDARLPTDDVSMARLRANPFSRPTACLVLLALLWMPAKRTMAETGMADESSANLVARGTVSVNDSVGQVLVTEENAAPHQQASNPATNQWLSPNGLGSSLQVVLLLSVLSLAPAILLMTTCYVRIIIVLSLLRQAIGLQTLPPTQVLTSVALFMTLLVMTPVWSEVYEDSIKPYTDPNTELSLGEAYHRGSVPIRRFMSQQIAAAENYDDVALFYQYAEPDGPMPSSFSDVPIRVLLPAYILSELKVAFLMGFKIFLPFLIVDLVVASVTMSMGMLMLPPHVIALPMKLLLFVLVDGWRMVVQMLLNSFVVAS